MQDVVIYLLNFIIVFSFIIILLVIFANDTEAKMRKKGKRKVFLKTKKIIKIPYQPSHWTSEGKSKEEIEEDYYCARTNLYHDYHGISQRRGSNRGTRDLLSYMWKPHLKIPTIHVTGTNGKGSVIRKLAGCLREAGYRVGEYTSPYMYTVREDIAINLQMISKADFVNYHQTCAWADRNRRKGFKSYIPKPNTFGYHFCMAMNYFVAKKVDIALIEVGISQELAINIAAGGYSDHTNIVKPEVSIITNVGLDHMKNYGYSKESIMYEKSGIIKRGRPVVLGHDMPLHIAIREAKKKKSPYYIIYPADQNNYTYDEINSKTVRQVLKLIQKKFPVNEEAITRGLRASLYGRGRLEEFNKQVLENIGNKWKLPKLPHKVFHEWKTNFGSVVGALKEMKTRYPELKLRVAIAGFKQELAKARITMVLKNADFAHFIESNLKNAIRYDKHKMDKYIEDASFDKTKFELFDKKSEGGHRDIEKVLKHIFEQSSENEDDEILLILGLTESLPKILGYEIPRETYPEIIPTKHECKKKIKLIPKYRYKYK